jgi:hypothetical protein
MLGAMPPDTAAGAALAAVVFEGPAGPDGVVIPASADAPLAFGRGAHCPIRFGHAPTPDLRLARHAGSFLVAGDRLVIESSPQPGHAPVQICLGDRPPVELPPGEAYGPAAVEYDVIVRGERAWVMHVRTRSRALAAGAPAGASVDPPTERRPLLLSDHQRQVLEAYVAPLRAGRLEPSTHAEVAERLSYSINKIRRDLYGIWQELVTCGVAVPDYGDKRVAVAHAALANHLT